MQDYLWELNLNYCLIYLNDIVVYSQTLDDHLCQLRAVFNQFWEHNLKLKPLKFTFFQEEITHLGHCVSVEGVKPSNYNVQKILDEPLPMTYTQIQEFIGMANHYCRFIKDFLKISQPLDYTKGKGAKKREALELTPEAIVAVHTLKKALTEGLH